MGLENKVIISAALTGEVTPTTLNPHIPVEPEEREFGKEPATPDEARQLLSLKCQAIR